jgi:hypothetical protein
LDEVLVEVDDDFLAAAIILVNAFDGRNERFVDDDDNGDTGGLEMLAAGTLDDTVVVVTDDGVGVSVSSSLSSNGLLDRNGDNMGRNNVDVVVDGDDVALGDDGVRLVDGDDTTANQSVSNDAAARDAAARRPYPIELRRPSDGLDI